MKRLIIFSISILFWWGCVPPPEVDHLKDASDFTNNITAANAFGGGNGSQSSPYLISNVQQLKKLVDDVNINRNGYADTFFKLMTDIQVTSDEWIPIGIDIENDYRNLAAFYGIFDGDGHTIKGTLKSNRNSDFGFFGILGANAQISNLTIDATVNNEGIFPDFEGVSTGGVAGWSIGAVIIQNCNVNGSVTGGLASESYTGGIVGDCTGTIQNCNVTGLVTSGLGYDMKFTGGIVGYCDSSTILNCNVLNTIIGGEGSFTYTGGIVGSGSDVIIINCTVLASAIVKGCDNEHEEGWSYCTTGGIIGHASNVMIRDCTNHANVFGFDFVGGLVGLIYYEGVIHTSLNTGNVSGNFDKTGGLAGSNYYRYNWGESSFGHVFDCCTNSGTVNSQAANFNNQVGSGEVETCSAGHTKR